ncbi:MAG: hypothetical protein ACJAT2_002333 [Bacteriovoracaceae bacterium]|jgi:hypothetical protein
MIRLSLGAEKEFKKTVETHCLNLADTYGGKICAALDRQHPRDLYDAKFLFDNEGITTDVKDSFIFYLLSHNRPINELLNPNLKDISVEYTDEFLDMAQSNVSLDELLKTRKRLISDINDSLTGEDRKFIISFAENNPDWSLFRNEKIKDYPSIKWKLLNQRSMKEKKSSEYIDKVKELLER